MMHLPCVNPVAIVTRHSEQTSLRHGRPMFINWSMMADDGGTHRHNNPVKKTNL